MTDFETRKNNHKKSINFESDTFIELRKSRSGKDFIDIYLEPSNEQELRYAEIVNSVITDFDELKAAINNGTAIDRPIEKNAALMVFLSISKKRMDNKEITSADYSKYYLKDDTEKEEYDSRKLALILADAAYIEADASTVKFICSKLGGKFLLNLVPYLLKFKDELKVILKERVLSSNLNDEDLNELEKFATDFHKIKEHRISNVDRKVK